MQGTHLFVLVCAFLSCFGFSKLGYSAGSECGNNKACLLYMNLTSTLPTQSELEETQSIIEKNGMFAAGEHIAKNSKEFVNVVLRDFADSWSDVDGNPGAVLNSTSATIIAAIVHKIDFRRILYDDIIAQGKGEVEKTGDTLILSGVLTSRGFAKAAFEAGTNRRMYPMILREAFCVELNDVQDPNIIEKYILRDVGKKDPDGSVTTFKAVCKTCHGAMDQLATAAIDYTFQSGSLRFNRSRPIPNTNKMLKIVESTGHIPKNDEWRTDFTENQLALFGIQSSERSGFGLKSFGKMISNSDGFARCQVKKAYRVACGQDAEEKDQNFLDKEFESLKQGYQLKNSFIRAAMYCAESEAADE